MGGARNKLPACMPDYLFVIWITSDLGYYPLYDLILVKFFKLYISYFCIFKYFFTLIVQTVTPLSFR